MNIILKNNDDFDFCHKNYYEILGVNVNATQEEIKDAYKSLAKIYHPDFSLYDNSTEIMQAINQAYETLSDVEQRKNYDKKLSIKGNYEAYSSYTKSKQESEYDFSDWLKDYLNKKRRLSKLYKDYQRIQKRQMIAKSSGMVVNPADIEESKKLELAISESFQSLTNCPSNYYQYIIKLLISELRSYLEKNDTLYCYYDKMYKYENDCMVSLLLVELTSSLEKALSSPEQCKDVILLILKEYLKTLDAISNCNISNAPIPSSVNNLNYFLLHLLRKHNNILFDVLQDLNMSVPNL